MNSQKSAFLKSSSVLLVALTVGLSACQKAQNASSEVSAKNVVKSGDPSVDQQIGDNSVSFRVMGSQALANNKAQQSVALPGEVDAVKVLRALSQSGSTSSYLLESSGNTTARTQDSLLLGIPMGLIGQQSMFGGVITKVSDPTSDTLGRLKLMDLTPMHVRSVVTNPDTTKAAITFVGCISNCDEMSAQKALFSLPIQAVDSKNNQLIVDLAALGDEMNLVQILDPVGSYTQLQPKTSKTIGFDFSDSTLVFDVQNDMIPIDADPADPKAPVTSFVTRWYLKLSSSFNPAFVSRPAADGVGFFMTERSASPKINRFSVTEFGGEPIKYFLKHVPAEFQNAFAQCFDGWNDQFQTILGRRPITYEFLAENDPRNDLLVTGDIRFNIVEWDLNNIAPYGGLGPSIANQFTGETLSANVLIQGPTIVKLYKDWFKVSAQAADLQAQGQTAAAEGLLRDYFTSVQDLQAKRSAVSYKVSLGKSLEFRQNGASAALEDPLAQRNDFDEIPAGFTYETYMPGYFIDMLTHELGHNLGLRHNFRGNLGATNNTDLGSTSRSIMEYLGRGYRHLDRIGTYDTMAITYGYTGKQPDHKDWYCTDEDVGAPDSPDNSAECSRDDATADPYTYFEGRMNRAIGLLTSPGQKTAPAWSVDDMANELLSTTTGLLLYAATTDKNVSQLSTFQSRSERPKDAQSIKTYVLGRLAGQVCANFDAAVAEKADDAAKKKVQDNVTALKAKVKEIKDQFAGLKAETLGGCLQ